MKISLIVLFMACGIAALLTAGSGCGLILGLLDTERMLWVLCFDVIIGSLSTIGIAAYAIIDSMFDM